jgi:hypothetical protein
MLNEEEILSSIFGDSKWKNKYPVEWCSLCDTAIIGCAVCAGTTCNGHSCEFCNQDFDEFCDCKRRVSDYLTEDETAIYQKSLRIKKFILETLRDGDKEIDWNKLNENGELSQNDQNMFL